MDFEAIMPKQWRIAKAGGLEHANCKGEYQEASNSFPYVIKRKRVTNLQKGITEMKFSIVFVDSGGNKLTKEMEFAEQDIASNKFLKKLPIEVIIMPGFRNKIQELFSYMIKKQLNGQKITEEMQYGYGWNGRKFHWGDKNKRAISESQLYSAVVHIAEIISQEKEIIPGLLLSAVHGPLKGVLQEAGIKHDFSTFLTGPSATGKTSLTGIFCEYMPEMKIKYACTSERKILEKAIRGHRDTTLILDDYCKSTSERMNAKLEFTISEIIQDSCDSGRKLTDQESDENLSCSPHLVITGEKIIYNESTLNRCFLLKMEKSVSKELWVDIKNMDENMEMFIFMKDFMEFIENDYESVVEKCKVDYEYYLKEMRGRRELQCSSINRLAETLAVQSTIKNQILGYFRERLMDDKPYEKISSSFESCIISSGVVLKQEIDDMQKTVRELRLLPALAQIVLASAGDIVKTEKQYFKYIENGKRCTGANIHPGYLSFKKDQMLKLIAGHLKEVSISEKEFDKEIRSLPVKITSPDSDGKNSCRWKTTQRMYHVWVRGLLEWTCETRGGNPEWDEYCAKYFEAGQGDKYSMMEFLGSNTNCCQISKQ